MSALKAKNTAQPIKSIEFVWNYNDTLEATDGVEYALGADTSSDIIANTKTFVIGYLPKNAVVVGGAVVTRTAFDTAGYDVKVGDLEDDDEYHAQADLKDAGAGTFITTHVKKYTADQTTLTMTVQSDDACTAGAGYIRIDYIVEGRADEVTHPGA